ncbi:zinc finger MYM-type protein 1-like isoform X1 [Tachysurus ichikawai]
MHLRRPASVSKGPSEEAESSTSQDTVTDSPNPASTGRNEGDSEGDFLTIDPGLCPERFTDHEREVIVRKLATASQTDLKTIMPKDSEEKKFPEYLQFSKSANGASPKRWAILTSQTGCSLQRLSETRWSARIAAVKPVANHLPSIIEALDTILAKCSLTNEARSEASGLKQYFMSFKAIVLTVWKKILQSIEDRNLILQSGKISIKVEIDNIQYGPLRGDGCFA